MKIEIWSDYVCPFCYIGKKQLEQAIQDTGYSGHVELVYKSYQLDPTTPVDTNVSTYEALAKKYGMSLEKAKEMTQGVAARAKEVGLDYNFDDSMEENTLKEWNAYKVLNIKAKITSDTELPFPIKKALSMSQQAQIHPVEVCNFLVKEALSMGAKIYTNTRVQQLNIPQNNLHTANHLTVQYKKLILCTHYPIEAFRGLQLFKLSNSRSYMVAGKITDTLQGQYLCVDNPTRSIRTATINGEHYLVLGGANHIAGETANTKPYYEAIQNEMRAHFDQNPIYRWSAQDIETPDMVPYVGRITQSLPNVFIATGYRKWGISNSFVAGDLLSSLITGAGNEDGAIPLYSPARTKFGAQFMQMLKVGGFVAKEFVTGYVKHANTPTCTHLGCKTKWNEADETWDCPCHGSRFNAKGEVLEGPAVHPLKLE